MRLVSTEKLNLSNSLAIRTLVLLQLLCLTILIGACSPIRSISYDYNRAVDFSGLRTYDWMPVPAEMQEKEALMLERIKKAVNSRLEAKGFRITRGEPDFLVATSFGQARFTRMASVKSSLLSHARRAFMTFVQQANCKEQQQCIKRRATR